MSRTAYNTGFEGRTFLLEDEWRTYLRRKPVRYIKKGKLQACEVCGEPEAENNSFHNAHRIGFHIGIVELALTPDFLDGDKNIVTAHRATCNNGAELDLESSLRFLISIGVQSLPFFLPAKTLALWAKLTRE